MGFFNFFKKKSKKVSTPKKEKRQSIPSIVLPKHMRSKVNDYGIRKSENAKSIILHLIEDFPTSPFNKKAENARIKAVRHALKVDGTGRVIQSTLSKRRSEAVRKDIIFRLDVQRTQHQKGERSSVCQKYAEQKTCVACYREQSPLYTKYGTLEKAHEAWKSLTRKENSSKRASQKLSEEQIIHDVPQPKDDLNGSPYSPFGQLNRTIQAMNAKDKEVYGNMNTPTSSLKTTLEAQKLFEKMKNEELARRKEIAIEEARIKEIEKNRIATIREQAQKMYDEWQRGNDNA